MTDYLHFPIHEFDQQDRHGFSYVPYPPEWVADRLNPLREQLEILRAALGGRPMRIVSGYRSPGYNAALPGAARRSQHMAGRAADIKVDGLTAKAVHDKALDLVRAGVMRLGGLGSYPTFTHIDIRPTTRLHRWTGSRLDT